MKGENSHGYYVTTSSMHSDCWNILAALTKCELGHLAYNSSVKNQTEFMNGLTGSWESVKV